MRHKFLGFITVSLFNFEKKDLTCYPIIQWSWESSSFNAGSVIAANYCTVIVARLYGILSEHVCVLFNLLKTFIAIALAISTWLIVALLIESSGVPEIKSVQINQNSNTEENCYLQKNWIIIVRAWNNFLMLDFCLTIYV